MKNKHKIILIILLQITLTACEKQQVLSQQNTTPNPNTISLNSPDTSPVPTQNTPSKNNNTGNNSNPFQANPNNTNSVTTPIQAINQYSVSDLQMVGTIITDSQQYALIAAPDGNTCTVSIGDKIGKEAAEVTSITPDQVILKVTRDFNGSSYQQLVELTLNKQSAQSSSGLSV